MAERELTDVELERVLAGELPEARVTLPADQARLAELRTEHAAFLGSIDVAAEVRAIERRAKQVAPEPAPKRLAAWWRWAMGGGALVAAAAAVLLMVNRRPPSDPGDDDDLRQKGDGITLVIHTPTRELASGDSVAPGEKIRFEVGAPRRGYVVVFGVDGAGATTIYYPFKATAPASYDPTARVLPGAIQLDATAGAERFFAVYAEQPFALDAVVPAVVRAQPPKGVSAAEVVLKKLLENK